MTFPPPYFSVSFQSLLDDATKVTFEPQNGFCLKPETIIEKSECFVFVFCFFVFFLFWKLAPVQHFGNVEICNLSPLNSIRDQLTVDDDLVIRKQLNNLLVFRDDDIFPADKSIPFLNPKSTNNNIIEICNRTSFFLLKVIDFQTVERTPSGENLIFLAFCSSQWKRVWI